MFNQAITNYSEVLKKVEEIDEEETTLKTLMTNSRRAFSSKSLEVDNLYKQLLVYDYMLEYLGQMYSNLRKFMLVMS